MCLPYYNTLAVKEFLKGMIKDSIGINNITFCFIGITFATLPIEILLYSLL